MNSKIGIHAPSVLTLFVLSPLLAEIVVGSIPATRFMDFIPAIGLYGSGAVVIREIAQRLKLGWLSVIGLGLAFGIVEEAIALQSVFNPDFFGLDLSFGRWLGVNWVWAVFIVFYHALFSIAIPVRITEFIFHRKSEVPWTTGLSLLLVALLYLFMLFYYYRLFLGFTNFNASVWHQSIAIASATLIVLIAVRLHKKSYAAFTKLKNVWGSALSFLLALIWFMLFTTVFIENDGLDPLLIMVAGVAAMAGLIMVLYRLQNSATPVSYINAVIICLMVQGLYGALVLSESDNLIDRLTQVFVSMSVLTGLFFLKRKFNITKTIKL